MPDTMIAGPPPGDAPAARQLGFAWMVLPRHGRRPLGFEGRLLLRAASRPPGLPMWSELAVHESANGPLVAGVRHRMRESDGSPAGEDLCYAEAQPDAEALLDWLNLHDPVADLPANVLMAPGSPTGGLDTAAALRASWHALLAAIFGGAARDGTRGGTALADATSDTPGENG